VPWVDKPGSAGVSPAFRETDAAWTPAFPGLESKLKDPEGAALLEVIGLLCIFMSRAINNLAFVAHVDRREFTELVLQLLVFAHVVYERAKTF
jgi:hypothetical protein